MIKLVSSLQTWNTPAFISNLKEEICSLDSSLLPLQQGLRYSSIANADSLSVSVLKTSEDEDHIFIKAGLFYTGIIAGCNCADDPTPVDENNEYCEVSISINKVTAEATINLVH